MHIEVSLISKLACSKCMLNKLIILSSEVVVKILFVTHSSTYSSECKCRTGCALNIFDIFLKKKKPCNMLGLLYSDWGVGWTIRKWWL